MKASSIGLNGLIKLTEGIQLPMDELKVEHIPLNVIPVTEYDPFEAKFAASLYWLVFRATEDGEFDNIPSQVTSPIQRDSEKRITVRSEVTEFLTNGEIYGKVCDAIFHSKVPVVGQWAIIQTLSRHGFYVVEEGDIAVTDSALQQRKPFRKSTHLALMDCLMSAFSSRAVSVPQVVQSVSKFSSFNASKELPFDLEDALLLWINKICAALNENQLKKQRQHAEQLLQNQDKAKRFRFRRDQLQPKVQTEFPVMEDLLKDISDGQSLLAIIMFYNPTVVSLEDIRFGNNLSTEDCVHNLDLFRTLCSQFICTSILALKLEDLLYGSQAMKPNVIALLAEIFNKCEVESQSPENGIKERRTSKSDVDLRYIVANKENVVDNRSSSAPVLNSDKNGGIEHGSPRVTTKNKNEHFSTMSGQLKSSSSDRIEQLKSGVWKSQSDTQVNTNSRLSFKSPFQLDFTVVDDVQQPPLNGPSSKQDVHEKDIKGKENPFSGIFQRPVLVGDRKGSLPSTGTGGSPRVTPRQEHPLLLRRNKQKQRTLDLEEWDMQQEEVEELHLNDRQRSQSLTGLDKAKVEPRQSFHAWREDTGASLSDTNLAASRNEKISLDFRPNVSTSASQRGTEGSIPQRGAEGINVPMKSSGSKAKREEHSSQDSLSSTDSLNIRDKPRNSLMSGVGDSCASDISVKELSQFEEIEAKILAGKSVETPRTFAKPKAKRSKAPPPQEDEDEMNTSVSSEDMNMFRLEVLQRLTEDKLQQMPDGAEMEDDDDPIFVARNNAASGSSNAPDQRTGLEVPNAPADDPTDQLSPITETSEPVVSNPNSVSSANSTTPSSPCSPLDVAPFMPAFFTTSPANTLERKSQRFSIKNRKDTEETLVGEEEDDFPSEPGTSATPRFQEKSREKNGLFPAQSKSFEQLARGSYTVGHVSMESAEAAGIPVIGAGRPVSEAGIPVQATGYPGLPIRKITDSSTSASSYQGSEVFQSKKPSHRETDVSRDLSGFRPLALSSGGVESSGVATEAEGMDGRRDSLETSPALSPALIREKRDDARQEAALRSREIQAQDSPSDVVIFERSLSNLPEENTSRDPHTSQMSENAHYNSETVTRSSKSVAYVFDFNQDTVQHYQNGHAQDFRTFKKGEQDRQAEREVPQGNRFAASFNEDTADQRSQRSQQDTHFGTYNKKPHSNEQEQSTAGQQQMSDSLDGRPPHRTSEEARTQGVNMKDLRQSEGFSTFRKDSTSEMNSGEVEPTAHALDVRRSDGYSTFRKRGSAAASENQSARLSTTSTHDQRKIEADRFSTFAKKHSDGQNYVQEGLQHFQATNTSERTDLQQATMAVRTSSSGGGVGEREYSPRGEEEEQIRVSGSSNINRSRTFRKTPDGQIIDDRSIRRSISSGHEKNHSPSNSDSKLSGQQTVVTNVRVSPEGAGSDNPHRISWTDESEAGARLTRQLNASVDRSTTLERGPTSSPRRQRSPRQTGRGSPGARISWLTAAKSGVGGQVILNDKDCMQEDTGTKHSPAKFSGHERPHFIAPAVFHPRSLHQLEGSPWKQNAPDHMITEGQSPAVSFGLLFNSNTLTDTTSAVNHGPKTSSGDASSTTSEPERRAGGSIRDRIAALSAAAGVSCLNVTPGREESHVDVAPGREQSKEAAEKSVAFDVEFQKAPKPRPPPRLTSRFRTKDLEGKEKPACETRVVNEKELGAVKNREFTVENNKKFGVVNNKELGAVGDKSAAFEVCFDDEPRSKRSKEEVGLMQSPFKAFKTRSNLRHQQKSSVKIQLQRTNVDEGSLICAQNDDWKENRSLSSFCSDAVSAEKTTSHNLSVDITSSQRKTQQEDFKVCSNSEVPKLQKRNSFTLDSVPKFTENTSDQELLIVQGLNELANKEEPKSNERERGSNSEVPKLQKRNTFTLDSASQYIENASTQGLSVPKALNALESKTESKNAKEQCLPSGHLQKRNTFTLDSVSRDGLPIITVLNEMASREEMKKNKQHSVFPDETTQKRGTFTLDSVSQTIENASEEGVHVATVLNDLASKEELKQNKQQSDDGPSALQDETSLKRSTFTLESVSQEIDSAIEKYFPNESVNIATKDSTSIEKQEHSEKRLTNTGDSASMPLQSEGDESLPGNEVLLQLTKQDELQSSRMSDTEETAAKRGTFTLDSVSQTLEEAQDKGLPTVQALHQLASEEERLSSTETLSMVMCHPNPPQNRGTYTLDTVSHAIEEAVEKGIPVSVTLNHLSQDHQHAHAHHCKDVTAGEVTRGFKRPDAPALSSEPRDEFEASFEHALEQLEDCVTCDSGEEFSTFSNRERPLSETPGKRGTYDLEDVSTSLQDDAKDGVPVVETLERLSRGDLPKDGNIKNQPSEEKRGTYTLDEVSRSLQTAEEQGIPVVEALQNLTRNKETSSESVEIEESAGKRGTYTLNEVSKSLEHAEKTGIPVIDALEALCKDTPKSPLRLKIPDRGTYTLDKVSLTLEHAKQKGLPIVDALRHLTASKDSPVRQTPDAVHRRQGKLVNRKTYALASPLETIGEGTKLRLYDGSKKQMMSPISFHVKSKEVTASEPSGNDNKTRGLGVVQKLDFLTSACERLLKANAKEMARDEQLTEGTQTDPTSDESVAGSHEARPEACSGQPERNTYSLESVSLTIDDAKAKGIPVVETLKHVTSVAKPTATHGSNLTRLNSKSDSEILNDGSKKETTSDRSTHSLENVSRTLEEAKKAGIPVIQALDQLTNELAEFSLTAMSGDIPMTQLGRDNRKRKRYSETTIKEPYPSPHGSSYPPPIRKAYSLGDVAFAVQQAFQSGTSLDDFLDGIAFEKPAEPVMSSSRDVRPRSVDSGFVSSFSDNDISSQSIESSRNRTNTYIFDSSNEDLDLAKLVAPVKDLSFDGKNTTGSSNVNQDSNRRTFTLDHVTELTRDIPVIEALEKLSNSIVLQTDNTKELECKEKAKNMPTDVTLPRKSNSERKKSPPKPKRQFFKKVKSPQANSDSFVVEFFDSNVPQRATSKFEIVNDKVKQVSNSVQPVKDLREAENNAPPSSVSSIEKNSENPFNDRQISLDKHLVYIDLVPIRDPDTIGLESKEPVPVSSSTPTRARATWRPSGSVLDKIASLMDAAEDCGMSPADVLNQASDLRSDAEGEIEELEQDEAEDEQALTSQLAYLRMQLDEKRRHIEAEKHRAQSEWEDQRRRLGQTAFWYVMGKARGGQTVGEGPGSEVVHSDKGPVMKPQSHEQPRKPVAEFPDQPSPPIAWSSPANSPLPASASHPSSNGQQFETREFRLSNYPPGNELGTNQGMMRPSSQPAVEVSSRPTPIPPRPSSHDPAGHHMTPTRKCWNVDVGQTFTPPPLVRPDTASVNMDTKQETVSSGGSGTAEIEVENQTPLKKGLAMFIGDDASTGSQGLTPEQEKKREKFMRLRQKKQEEDRTRKEAELEKKRRREEKQREKEMLQKMEEERLRQEELERQRAEQELRIREAQAARVPDSFATYRRSGPRQQVYDINDDANSYYVSGPTHAQPSGFAEFSGPQCYVKPSGKSNRKIIVNAISHVCLSGTVNQDQKEKCLQAISEHDGHHFMILFKDGLKFRGIYVHNLENDQLFKVFGIGPRVVTSKMIDFLYKYNSGGKEFTKIPSKTISISVDGFAIQKSCWNSGKPVVSSKTASNLKRPPRPPQR